MYMFCTVCFFFFLLLWNICSIHIWDLIFLSWDVTLYLNWRDFYFVYVDSLLSWFYVMLWFGDVLSVCKTYYNKDNWYKNILSWICGLNKVYLKSVWKFKNYYFFIWIGNENNFLWRRKRIIWHVFVI